MGISASLDARPDRIDLRDRQYLPPLKAIDPVYPQPKIPIQAIHLYLQHQMILDQEKEGSCTGFGLASVINALLWRKAVLKFDASSGLSIREKYNLPEKVSTRMLYHLARFYDEWPGDDYEGSSCRGALKAWFKHGVCSEKLWPYRKGFFVASSEGWAEDAASRPLGIYCRIEKGSIRDMQAAIQEVGAVYCSASVHKGWTMNGLPEGTRFLKHEDLPGIIWNPDWDPKERNIGRHAFSLVGYNSQGFVVQNSWGVDWGFSGFAIFTYDDWLANGSDAWVAVMGAPIKLRYPRRFVAGELSGIPLDNEVKAAFVPSHRAVVRDGKYPWTREDAYLQTVVMGNDGKVVNRLVVQKDGESAVRHVVFERAEAFFEGRNDRGTPKIVIYAHGGLNTEENSLERIRKLGPCFFDNGIYPVFFTWKTGLMESLYGILEDSAKRLFPQDGGFTRILESADEYLEDALDRTIEVAAENLGIKAIWSQMKKNAAEASMQKNFDRGVFLTTRELANLKKKVPDLEIHLVGHSAGAILLGHMLDNLSRKKLHVKTCILYAPACSIDFAARYYQKAVELNILPLENIHIDLLKNELELEDTVGPHGPYSKSLLYLVSRALKEFHKTPLLGMEKSFDKNTVKPGKNRNFWHPSTFSNLDKWQEFWGDNPIHPIQTEQVPTRVTWQRGRIITVEKWINAAHGAFDNDVLIVTNTIKRITGRRRMKEFITDLEY